jgi:hypothetical protein
LLRLLIPSTLEQGATTMYKTKVSKKGLFIPLDYVKGLNEVVVIRKKNDLIIRPAETMTEKTAGIIKTNLSVHDVLNSYTGYLANLESNNETV